MVSTWMVCPPGKATSCECKSACEEEEVKPHEIENVVSKTALAAADGTRMN